MLTMKGSNVKVTLSTQVFFIDYLTSTSFWGDRKGGRGVGSLWPDMTSFLHCSCPTIISGDEQKCFYLLLSPGWHIMPLFDGNDLWPLINMNRGTFRTSQFWSLAVSRVRNELDDRAGFSHRERIFCSLLLLRQLDKPTQERALIQFFLHSTFDFV